MHIINRNQDQIRINLLGIVKVCWEHILVIALAALLCGAVALGGAYFFLTPQYSANIVIYINNYSTSDSTSTITTGDLTAAAKLVNTYAAIISSRTVMDSVAQETEVGYDINTLIGKVSVTSVNDTEVFQVSVTDPDPAVAAELANAIADVIPDKIASIVQGSSAVVIDYAQVPTAPVSPNYAKCAGAGLAVGLLLSMLFFIIREVMNTSIRQPSDLSQWEYPVLGIVPDFEDAASAQSGKYQYQYQYKKVQSAH